MSVGYDISASLSVPLAERFVSINGEGQRAGYLACFIRFPHCNLRCSYCDTMWANETHSSFEEIALVDLVDWVAHAGVSCVTITGGEPLLQRALPDLLHMLDATCPHLWVELETNGSRPLDIYVDMRKAFDVHKGITLSFTMDWKTPSSGMNELMCADNLSLLTKRDTLKFVVGDITDLDQMRTLCEKLDLFKRTNVFISPISGIINPADIVAYMQEYHLRDARLQLQLHKIIWPHEVKGV